MPAYCTDTSRRIYPAYRTTPKAKVCEVLHAVGWLLKAENGRWQHQRKRNGTKSRYYVLINEAPPETEE